MMEVIVNVDEDDDGNSQVTIEIKKKNIMVQIEDGFLGEKITVYAPKRFESVHIPTIPDVIADIIRENRSDKL